MQTLYMQSVRVGWVAVHTPYGVLVKCSVAVPAWNSLLILLVNLRNVQNATELRPAGGLAWPVPAATCRMHHIRHPIAIAIPIPSRESPQLRDLDRRHFKALFLSASLLFCNIIISRLSMPKGPNQSLRKLCSLGLASPARS